MAYVALYRKWRPLTFDEVVEQESIVTILKNTVKTGRIAHAYLFCGTRGTGKTTLAKIFARAINCLSPKEGNPCNECDICKGILSGQILDVSEIDAASNNGVDNIRAIIDETNYAPSISKYRVYIIDEVHMLSTGAFNALLKTLEEPPSGVVFILATTEPHKLPVTILSRCQRYDFKRISRQGIMARLEEICKDIGVKYETQALNFIAQKADGALRDAISILDQTIAASQNNITLKAARDTSGSLDRMFIEQFAEKLLLQDGGSILKLSDSIFADGRDPSNFISELMRLFRSLLIVLNIDNPKELLYEDDEEIERLKKLSSLTNTKEIAYLVKELSKLENNLKWAVQRKIVFEAGMLNLCDRRTSTEDDMEDRISLLESKLADLVANGLKYTQVTPVVTADEKVEKVEKKKEEKIEEPKPEPKKEEIDEAKPKKESKNAKPIDTLDWNDFLQNITDKNKSSISALIRVNSKGFVLEPNYLIIAFSNKMMMDMVVRNNVFDILDESASIAFGKPMKVKLLMEDELEAFSASTYTGEKEQEKTEEDDDFENALNLLSQLAEDEGFEIVNIE